MMCLYNSKAICAGCHACEIKYANEDDEILLEQAFHYMHVGFLTRVDFTDSIV